MSKEVEQVHAIKEMAKRRAHASSRHSRGLFETGVCPACNVNLHIRAVGPNTLFVCPRCSWTHQIRGDFPGAKLPGEFYQKSSGSKGKTVLVYGPDGKPRSIK